MTRAGVALTDMAPVLATPVSRPLLRSMVAALPGGTSQPSRRTRVLTLTFGGTNSYNCRPKLC